MKSPVFIIGNPRSGTTLFRLMLTCHPRIVIAPECGFALWLYPKYGHWQEHDNDVSLERFLADLLKCKKIETWGLEKDELEAFLLAERPVTYAALVAAVYRHYADRVGPGYSRWGDKNNYYLDHIGEIAELFPEAVFLHIVRDGRSVACSYRKLGEAMVESRYAPRLPFEVAEIAQHWKTNVEAIRESFDALSAGNAFEYRFEDLVTDPAGVLTRVCRDLGENFDQRMLEYPRLNREQQLEPRDFMSWKAKTLKPPIASEASRYERDLSSSQREEFEGIAGPILERYQYL